MIDAQQTTAEKNAATRRELRSRLYQRHALRGGGGGSSFSAHHHVFGASVGRRAHFRSASGPVSRGFGHGKELSDTALPPESDLAANLFPKSIVATAVPTITSGFHSVDQIGWYDSAFFLCLATFQAF